MTRTLLRGAQVITMAPNRADVERVDILIEDERILEMDDHLDSPDAAIVDLSGLVNAHCTRGRPRHASSGRTGPSWNTSPACTAVWPSDTVPTAIEALVPSAVASPRTGIAKVDNA